MSIRKLYVMGIILSVVAVLYAQADKQVKISGYLIDNACANTFVKNGDLGERVRRHSTSCALMPNCAGSGYAVYSEGKLYKLDKAGSKTAADILKDTDTKTGVKVAVEGTVEGDTLRVSKLTEVK